MTVRDERRRARRYALNWVARVRLSSGRSFSKRNLAREDLTGPGGVSGNQYETRQDAMFAFASELKKALATKSLSAITRDRDNKASDGVIELVGRLKNLSSRGAYVYLIAPLPIGSRLEISIKLPLGREIWMNYAAVVVRTSNTSRTPGVALKFDTSRPIFNTVPAW